VLRSEGVDTLFLLNFLDELLRRAPAENDVSLFKRREFPKAPASFLMS
jgi:hypothetical protein